MKNISLCTLYSVWGDNLKKEKIKKFKKFSIFFENSNNYSFQKYLKEIRKQSDDS